jgi:CRP/FNR family cyclic AMP-dependent transcriptional regulator
MNTSATDPPTFALVSPPPQRIAEVNGCCESPPPSDCALLVRHSLMLFPIGSRVCLPGDSRDGNQTCDNWPAPIRVASTPGDPMSEDVTSRSQLHELLARSRVLGVLAPEDRARLSEQCVGRQFAKNQVVYVAGGPADSMLVLTSGELKVSNYSADGAELILSLVLPGETIGELGMLSDLARSATVIATKPSAAMMLSRAVVMQLIEERPAVAVAMLQHLAYMTRKMNGVAADLVFLDVHQRVARFLVTHTRGPSGSVRVTQAHLGSTIGASRQRVNMCLQEFQREGWVALSSGTIRIVDRDALTLAMED